MYPAISKILLHWLYLSLFFKCNVWLPVISFSTWRCIFYLMNFFFNLATGLFLYLTSLTTISWYHQMPRLYSNFSDGLFFLFPFLLSFPFPSFLSSLPYSLLFLLPSLPLFCSFLRSFSISVFEFNARPTHCIWLFWGSCSFLRPSLDFNANALGKRDPLSWEHPTF